MKYIFLAFFVIVNSYVIGGEYDNFRAPTVSILSHPATINSKGGFSLTIAFVNDHKEPVRIRRSQYDFNDFAIVLSQGKNRRMLGMLLGGHPSGGDYHVLAKGQYLEHTIQVPMLSAEREATTDVIGNVISIDDFFMKDGPIIPGEYKLSVIYQNGRLSDEGNFIGKVETEPVDIKVISSEK